MDRTARYESAAVGLMILAGVALVGHQHSLTQDHGNDLYAGWAVTQGLRPFRDFHYLYGPLAAYALAMGFKVFGASALAARILAEIALVAGAWGLFRLLRPAVGAPVTFLLALAGFAWGQPFQHYSYPLVLPMTVLAFHALVRYTDTRRRAWLVLLVTAAVAVGGLKLNAGAALMAALSLALWLSHRVPCHDEHSKTNVSRAWVVPLGAVVAWAGLIALLYGPFVRGVAGEYLRLCLPLTTRLLDDPRRPWVAALALPDVVLARIQEGRLPHWSDLLQRGWLLPFLYGSCLAGFLPVALRDTLGRAALSGDRGLRAGLWWAHLFTGHEFLIRGTFYSTFQFPLLTTLALTGYALRPLASRVSAGWPWLVLGCVGFFGAVRLEWPSPSVYASQARARLWVRPSDLLPVAEEVRAFLDRRLPAGEPIAVFPYGPLYLFLSGRRHALWRYTFYREWGMSPRETSDIMSQLERGPVRCVLIGNFDEVEGFGRSFAREVWAYLRRHYVPVLIPNVRGGWGVEARAARHPEKMVVLWRRGEPLPVRPAPWPWAEGGPLDRRGGVK